MKRDLRLYIKDILEQMEKAEAFIGDMDYNAFFADEKTCYAVQRCLEIIGEAAKQVPEEIRKRYSTIPWREMAGMRDKITHFYFGVDPEKVWLVVKRDIPSLKPQINYILEELSNT